ncbi:MAG: hypothetical protein J6I62_08095 [Selenomonadaceae bacterium]|nr:hypothetical protein [Selenomonadaceae bacterium]
MVMDIEKALKGIDFSKTSLIKERLWKEISEKTNEYSPKECLSISLSHNMMHKKISEGIFELTDETLDEVAAAGLNLHDNNEETNPKADDLKKR